MDLGCLVITGNATVNKIYDYNSCLPYMQKLLWHEIFAVKQIGFLQLHYADHLPTAFHSFHTMTKYHIILRVKGQVICLAMHRSTAPPKLCPEFHACAPV